MPPPNHHTGVACPAGMRGEHAHVHVHRRHVRIARMEHERDAHRLERRAGELAARCCVADGGSARARDVREAAAARARTRLPPSSMREHRRRRPPGRVPGVAQERVAVDRLEARDDALLQAEQVVADGGGVQSSSALSNGAVADVACGTACRRSGCLPRPRRRAAAPLHRVAQRRHAQHAAAGRDDLAVLQRRAGVEHLRRRRSSVAAGRVITSPLRGASG